MKRNNMVKQLGLPKLPKVAKEPFTWNKPVVSPSSKNMGTTERLERNKGVEEAKSKFTVETRKHIDKRRGLK